MSEDCEIEWKVPFEDTVTKRVLDSIVFPEDSDAQFKWKATVVNDFESPSVFLQLKSKRHPDCIMLSVQCWFFIKTEDGSTIVDRKGKKLNDEFWGIYFFYDSHKLLLKIGEVPLIFGARVSVRCDALKIAKKFICEKDYSFSMKDGTLCDVILQTEDKTTFRVHSFMLTTRSKVFAAMFSNEMIETLTGLVNIRKFSGYTMRYVVHFIYNETFGSPDFNVALNLLEAAEYFALEDLKNQCAIYLSRFIDLEHAWQILLNAHIFCAKNLETTTLKFIAVYKEVLADRHEYQTFPKTLLLDIVKAFSNDYV